MATSTADYVNQGFKGYSGIFDQRQKYDLSDKIITRSRIAAKTFNILVKNLTKMAVRDSEPRIFEYTEENDVFTMDGDAGTGTSISLADSDGQLLQAGDTLEVIPISITSAPTLETITVVSVGATGSGTSGSGYTMVTVTRGGSTDLAEADHHLVWSGNAVEDGGAGSYPISKEPTYVYQYLQTFDKAIGENRNVKNSDFYAKSFFAMPATASRKRDQLMSHVNWKFFLGQRSRTTVNNQYKRQTGGLYEIIDSTNKITMSGKMSVDFWEQYTDLYFFKNGNTRKEKFIVMGGGFRTLYHQMFTGYYQLNVNETLSKYYGFKITSQDWAGGTLHNYTEDNWHGTGLYNCAFIYDMDYLAYMYLNGSDIQLVKDVTERRAKWNKEEWKIFGELGLFRTYDLAHIFLYNPSAPA